MAKSLVKKGSALSWFPRSEGFWVCFGLFAFTLAVAWHQMTHPLLMPMTAADTGIHYPFKFYWIRSLLEGHPAFWNPYVALGIPFVAHPSVAAFSPFNAIFLALHDRIQYAFAIENFLHLWMAAVGVYALLRAWGCRWEAGAVAGSAFAFQAFMNTHHWFGQFSMPLAACWIPWMVFFLHQGVMTRRLAWLLGASACTALSFFEGYPQIAYYGMLFCGLYLLACWWRGLLDLKRLAAASILYVGAFLLLVSCLLLPFLEFKGHSNRSEWGYEFIMSDFQVPDNLNYLLRPGYVGDPIKGDYSEEGRWSYTESAIYVGVVPFLLFLLGLYLLAKRSWTYVLAGFLGAVAVLGVMAWATALSPDPRNPSPWLVRIAGVFLIFLLVGTWRVAKVSRLYAFLAGTAILFYLMSMGRSAMLGEWVFKLFYHLVPGFGLSRSISRLNIVTTLCVVLCAGLALDHIVRKYLVKGGSGRPRWAKGLPLYGLALCLVALTGFDLWRYAKPFFTAKPFGFWEAKNMFPAPLSEEILADKSLPRIQPMSWVNSNILFKVGQLKGSDMMFLKEAGHFRAKLEEDYDGPLSDLARLKYLQTETKDLDKGGRWRMALKTYYHHYVNEKALPRCFLVGKAVASPDPRSSILTIQKGWSDPREQALITGEKVPFEGEPGFLGEPTSLNYRDTEVVAKVEAPRPCYLFLSDNIYPGWRAFVDGKQVPLFEANGPFRAVLLPTAGAHEVRMVFRPNYLLLGAIISFPAWLGLIALWTWGRGVGWGWPEAATVWLKAVLWPFGTRKDKKGKRKKR